MALKDILSSAKYGDDMVLNLPDGTTATVGEMRSLEATEKQNLIDRQNVMAKAEMAFAGKFQEAITAGWMTADGKIVAPRSDKEIRSAAANEFGLSEDDPLLGAVVKEFKAEIGKRDAAMESMKKEFQTALGQVTGVVKTSVGRYLDERYRNDFSTATKDLPKGVSVDYEKAYQYAAENNFKDKDGVLQIGQAVDRMTWDDRKKAELASLQEQASTAAEKKATLASVTRPRTAGPEAHRTKTDFDPFNERTDAHGNKVKQVKSFDEALAAAQNDEQLMQSALAAASFGVVQ